jgi:hypothetical protein
VLRFGGVKALTKNLHEDALKCLEDAKVEVVPQVLDNTGVLCDSLPLAARPERKLKVRAVKSRVKVSVKNSRLGKITRQLYDLESGCEPEKVLNIDLDLYQMEDY